MNYNLPQVRCACCVMPECQGKIALDDQGICQICQAHQKNQSAVQAAAANSFDNTSPEHKMNVFRKKIAKYQCPDSRYDCAVAVSGGKDSIMTLYLAVKVLNLRPLAIFIDNGFALQQMYDNVRNATDILGCDLTIFKTSDVTELFGTLLRSEKNVYYCRVCHALLDLMINKICTQNQIRLVLGGYTKGQQYIRATELFQIYDESDANTIEVISGHPKLSQYVELFQNQNAYFRKHFPQIVHISPFKYVEWNEEEILNTICTELKFRLPERSWPDKSSNCTFNYVSQLMAMKQFGFAQHETELSELVRRGELTRERALKIIETPIETQDLEEPLRKLDLSISDILKGEA